MVMTKRTHELILDAHLREKALLAKIAGEAQAEIEKLREDVRRLTAIIIQMRREGEVVPPEALEDGEGESWDVYNMEDADREYMDRQRDGG